MTNSRRSRRLLLAGALAVTVLATGSAQAAEASTVAVQPGEVRTDAVYLAAAGERNDVLVSQVDDFTLRISDAGAVIAVGDGCRSIDAHTAECSHPSGSPGPPYLHSVRLALGDRDDVVRSAEEVMPGTGDPTALPGPEITANGGPGSDLLEGGEVQDDLDGGGGHDTLRGYGNDDTLSDGDTSGAADADQFDGGPGADTVSYGARTEPVAVDLDDAAPEGEPNEGDVVRDVENVTGGQGDDTIGGSDEDNWLIGGGGADRIAGGNGFDELEGGRGRDRIYGQRGNDHVVGGSSSDTLYGGSGADVMAGGSSGDYISCGPENDTAVDPQAADLLARGCNDVSFNYSAGDATFVSASAYPVATRHGALTFAIGCPRPEQLGERCVAAHGTLELRDSRGKLMGSGVLTRRAGRRSAATRKPARVTVKLNGHGRYRLALRNGTAGTLSLRGHNLPSARWTVALRRVR